MQTILIGATLLGGAAAGPANSTRDYSASVPGNLVVMARSRFRPPTLMERHKKVSKVGRSTQQSHKYSARSIKAASQDAKQATQSGQGQFAEVAVRSKRELLSGSA